MAVPIATHDTLDALRRGDLAGVRELRLPGLSTFPREVFGLADTLEILDLSGGTLSALPDDLSRLHRLRVLFCSGNRFERLPPVLGDCQGLSQIGFRGVGLREVPGEALPPGLRWLTLTDNRLPRLPEALGQRPLLRKLMLAGNRLEFLPASLADAANLELVRLAANRFETMPGWLTRLPRMAWLSFAGNPFEPRLAQAATTAVAWADLRVGARLGEGASGHVHHAVWHGEGGGRAVALKLFKGAMTSDGLPEREMAACLAAGRHPNLTGALGSLQGHPDGRQGLLMPLLPADWRVLAGPPSLASCSRDVYDPDLRLGATAVLGIARSTAAAAAHLHARVILHGDLYAHNILWDGGAGRSVLTDFGAASALPDGEAGRPLQRIDVLAWGLLLGELLSRCDEPSSAIAGLRNLERACVDVDPNRRPLMEEALDVLNAFGAPT